MKVGRIKDSFFKDFYFVIALHPNTLYIRIIGVRVLGILGLPHLPSSHPFVAPDRHHVPIPGSLQEGPSSEYHLIGSGRTLNPKF